MKAYLLAAGYATRMYPLTRDRPKPLLDVAGVPILTHILERVVELPDVREVIIVGNARFNPEFEGWAQSQRSAVPIRVLNDGSMSDDDKLGALGDLAFALREAPPTSDWLVAAGDNLLEFRLGALHSAFQSHGAPLLAVRQVARDGPSSYNEVVLAADGLVESFREKPADPVSELAAIALYFFPNDVAAMLTTYLDEGGNRDAPGHFIAWLVNERQVRAAPLPGAWFDIGSLAGLADARQRFQPPVGLESRD